MSSPGILSNAALKQGTKKDPPPYHNFIAYAFVLPLYILAFPGTQGNGANF